MILVDTSVLIDFFRGKNNKPVKKLQTVLDHGISFGITPIIYQELLQGALNGKEFNELKEYLGSQYFYNVLQGNKSYEEAAHIYMRCRKKGFTPRSTIDLIIVQTAIENKLYLLHNDKDFEQIAKVINNLKLY